MAHPKLDVTVELQQQWRNNQLTLKPVFTGAEGQFNYLIRVTKQGASGSVTTQQAGQLSLQGMPLTASSVTLNLSPEDHCKVVLELLQDGQSLLTRTFECVVPDNQ